MAIISASDYKTFKGISGSTYDAQLAVVIPYVQGMAEEYCGRVFDETTYTGATAEKHDGTDSPILLLRNTPVTTLTSITMTYPDGTTDVVDSTTYTLDKDAGVVMFEPSSLKAVVRDSWMDDFTQDGTWTSSPKFAKGHQNISVVYTGGYSAGTMPSGLKYAMIQAVDAAMANARSGVGAGQYKSQRLGDYSEERFGQEELGQMVARLFGPWRRAEL